MNIQRIFFSLLYCLFVILFAIGCSLLIIYSFGPPSIENEDRVTIVDQNGGVLNDTVQSVEHIDELPEFLVQGILLAEDRHFYEHVGFDLRGIARAFIRNIESGQLKEGASTITQQLARNLYLSHEKTWTRKLKELYYTIRLEMFYSKDEILTTYVNCIYFGHGAYGLNEASHFYFGKNASQLSIAEATMLIGIPKGPTYYSPYNNIDNATKRQQFILEQLLRERFITEANFHEAKNESLPFLQNEQVQADNVNYFLNYVWHEATEQLRFKKESLLSQNVRIETTLDGDLQHESESINDREPLAKSDLEIGVISLDQASGAIRQMIGGKDFTASPFNRAVHAKRMVGSTFKPLLYYAALEHGFTATTMLNSEPTAFMMGEDVYEPSNYNEYYAHKPITLAQALALSDNIYAVKTHLFLSPEVVVQTTKQFGITTPLPEVASLALGSASIPLIEMVQAYAVIANGGYEITPYAIEKITTENGRVLYDKKRSNLHSVLNRQKAFLLIHLMSGMFDRRLNGYMEVTGSSIIDQLHHDYAGKSGTTQSDSWMIGFSPKLVTGVWVGYDDNRPLKKATEKALAKQAWAEMMQIAHQKEREKLTFTIPDGIVSKLIDVETGLLATEDCEITRTTYFEVGTEPTTYCTHHDHINHDEDRIEDEDEDDAPFYKKIIDLFPQPPSPE